MLLDLVDFFIYERLQLPELGQCTAALERAAHESKLGRHDLFLALLLGFFDLLLIHNRRLGAHDLRRGQLFFYRIQHRRLCFLRTKLGFKALFPFSFLAGHTVFALAL